MQKLFLALNLAVAATPALSARSYPLENEALICVSEDHDQERTHAKGSDDRHFYEIQSDNKNTKVLYVVSPRSEEQTKSVIMSLSSQYVHVLGAKGIFEFNGHDPTDDDGPAFAINGVALDDPIIAPNKLWVWTYVAKSWTLNGEMLGPIACTLAARF